MKLSLLATALATLATPSRSHSHELIFYAKDFLGTWQGDCGPVASTGLSSNGSFIRRYNFDHSVANVRYMFFADDACAESLFSFYAVFGLDLGSHVPGLPYTRTLFAPFIKLLVRPDSEQGSHALAACNATTIGHDYDVTLSGCPTLGFKPTTECAGDYDLLKGQPTRTEDDIVATFVPDA
ncbi:hypothetical protein LTR66_007140 [Elasticomyces elasticus]|nr:hypothetical protein LTR28_007048 [Elasticomyces elasticus]KAK4989096.1 hypothetical protein LTR66_007140 [Elasticomyces elasticus]